MSDSELNLTERPAVRYVTIDDNNTGQRIDNFLVTFLKGVPKGKIYNLLRKGEIRVNKKRTKPDYRLQNEDVVRIAPIVIAPESDKPVLSDRLKNEIESRIVYEDKGLIVINKPSGLAVHGGSGLSFGLVEVIRQMRPLEKFIELVHRLDRDTSGLIMVAKKRAVLKELHTALREKEGVQKTYLALVYGSWPKRKLQVNAPLLKNELQSGERIVRVHTDGKDSLTRFKLVRQFEGYSLVECEPVTGRTHQIRVHTQYAGYPIVGDDKYAPAESIKESKALGFKRLCLHATRLEIMLNGERMLFEAPLDKELQTLMNENLTDIFS
ncbi:MULTISPECIES: 23S rRNA pseudouridine(955/2504/2580) synthase RluC [Marinomonas]|uniref:Pseudouridine synthase n=1 Tax=Marinomonas arctica TaxID=383750 RepID=A0A7H1J192_9GAMM|nr:MULTISPECIES: 23S rRNA pseudouridine(955/2504/2580) synthase RluC [Marinomonas]MCS7487048.1 23S rRNA pseudouridylate synthase [Marinomonas sp. BSi20414]QNT04258.1 23S rRNA pseudouridine(955/2504/2580) synthase RluC [Marinomonas arctica]GGN34338.1 pseudouridine synthase [Marinomonas arctica]